MRRNGRSKIRGANASREGEEGAEAGIVQASALLGRGPIEGLSYPIDEDLFNKLPLLDWNDLVVFHRKGDHLLNPDGSFKTTEAGRYVGHKGVPAARGVSPDGPLAKAVAIKRR